MEGEESRLRYVDSQVKTRHPASTWVVAPTRPPSTMCAVTGIHDMTIAMSCLSSHMQLLIIL